MAEPEQEANTTRMKKAEFTDHLLGMREDSVSWVVAGSHFFDWEEINRSREKSLDAMRGTDFRAACVSVHVPGKGVLYRSFRIAG